MTLNKVHFDWAPEARTSGKAPDCGDGVCTQDIGKVTCEECVVQIVKITGDWAREFSLTTMEIFAHKVYFGLTDDDRGQAT